jgi:hypothetical protein
MQSRTKKDLEVFKRILELLEGMEVTTAFGTVRTYVETLAAIAARISEFAATQIASINAAKAGTERAREASRVLRDGFMRPVSKLGRSLFPNDPAIRKELRLPRRHDHQGVIAAGNAMAKLATVHKELFIKAGFAENFVELVSKGVTDFEKALAERDTHQGNRAAASAGLLGEITRGRDVVGLLDSLLRHHWAKEPDRLAKWRSFSRFIRKSQQSAASVPVVAPGVVPVPQVPAQPAAPVAVSPPTSPAVIPIASPSISPAVQSAASSDSAAKVA